MYTTKKVAGMFNIHPNTIRFYEKSNFLSPVHRDKNGYREFSEIHVKQISILRLLFINEWPGKRIREASLKLAKELPDWDTSNLRVSVKEYEYVIKQEIKKADEALRLLEHHDNPCYDDNITLSLADASEIIGVTRETVSTGKPPPGGWGEW